MNLMNGIKPQVDNYNINRELSIQEYIITLFVDIKKKIISIVFFITP